jgi:hypothetical protein
MNVKKHCDLCEHQILNLKKGAICGLTNKKASFNKTCLKIDFNNKIKKHLETLLIDLEVDKKNRSQIISKLIFNSIFGIILIFIGYFFFKNTIDKLTISVSTHNLIASISIFTGVIVISGYYLIKTPFVDLASFNKGIRINKKELFKIEEVLSLYKVSYKTDIKILKEVHGTQEYNFDIKIIK